MALTADNFMSMHKVCQDVIEDITELNNRPVNVFPTPEEIAMELETLRKGILNLAVVQRDLIAEVLRP